MRPAAQWRLALAMLWRDWRGGELTVLLLALVLAVAALTSVGFLSDRMRQGLDRDARQMLGADLRIRADRPVDPAFAAEAARLGLRTATTAIFPSMATPGGGAGARLSAVKAVSDAYPLRGAVDIVSSPGGAAHAATGVPAPGTVWVDPALLDALGLPLGGTIKLGDKPFRVAATIARELDRGYSFVNFSPRVMLRADDLAGTGLTGFGSRVTYRLLVSGNDAALARYTAWANARLAEPNARGVALESLEEGQPQVKATLDRAHRFLTLVALLTSLLAAVAIALGAHRFARRHVDGCAVMRCIGASARTLTVLFLVEFLLVGLIGGLIGVGIGFAGHAVLLNWLGALLRIDLPAPTLWPVAQGVGTALVLLLGFALPPLLPLTRVPPVKVLRREADPGRRGSVFGYTLGVALFAALLVASAGQWRLGLIVAGGFAAGLLVFGGLSWLCLRALARAARRERPAQRFGTRYALASLSRRGASSALQVTALAIGLMCLLLLAMTRNDLIAGWRQSTPPDAPDRFVIDIQPDQVDAVSRGLHALGVASPALSPMIRGRLTRHNGKAVSPDAYPEERTRRLVDREFNLSYTDVLPAGNRIGAGRWFGATDAGAPPGTKVSTERSMEMSMEAGIAKQLGVQLGDTLRFEVAGQAVDARVTSLRELDWGSFRVNFFVLMPPAALADLPATFITSFRLPPGAGPRLDALVQAMPNLTVIDTAAILAQLQGVLDQVIAAVQFLFAFTLAAGMLVLYAALAASRDERSRESALLRALGASQRQVGRVQLTEFVVVGAMAGLFAALGAQAIGWLLARRVFDFAIAFDPWLAPVGIVAGLACALLGGWWSLRQVLARPALASLRSQ
nr:FtsX-like permease family protein [Chitinasiproducens palmae]